MVFADDAQEPRLDRLRMFFHRREEPGDAGAVDPPRAEESRQGLMRAADLLEDLALNDGPREPAKLGDELAHRAPLAEVAIPADMGGEIPLEPGLVVPKSASRVAWPPLLPIGIGRRDVDELLAEPRPADAQVRVEPGV